MQTRSQSRSTTTSTSSTRNYNNRLRNRILKLETDCTPDNVNTNDLGPAYNTRLAHNVLSPNSYCLKNEIIHHYAPNNHRYNTRYSTRYNNDIDFDEASREWNRNKRRVGFNYEYTD